MQISALKQERKSCESARDQALEEKEMTISVIKWYSNLRSELKNYSIPVDDISEFARLVNNIRQHNGYDVDKVINEFWDLEMLRTNRSTLQNDIASLENRINSLKEHRSALETDVNIRNQTISAYNGLKNMGFGVKELDFLYDTKRLQTKMRFLQQKL
jgi:chromosome segregation ATPase